MRALVYIGPEQLELEEMATPVPELGESLVKIRYAGICGTDLHLWHGEMTAVQPPVVVGHELVGEIVEDTTGRYQAGQRVSGIGIEFRGSREVGFRGGRVLFHEREPSELHGDFRLPEGAKQLYDQRGTLVGYRRADGQNILFQEYAIGKDVMERRIHASGDPPTHAATDPYEHYVRLYEEETHWRLTVPHIIHPEEREWHDTRQGHIKWFIHPQMVTGLRGYEAYLQELPPGGWSGKHTHVGEEVHYIISGRGYEVIDGKRWDWEAGDVVAIPVCSTHQSFNADPAAPARFLAARQRLYEYYSYGGVEHHEDASPWPG